MLEDQSGLLSKACYAEVLVRERMGRPDAWGPTGVRQRTSEGNWRKPLRWNRLAVEGRLPDGSENEDGHRPRVFCASLADVFEPRPELEGWRHELFALIEATPELDWLLLTKRPDVALGEIHSWTRWNRIGWDFLPNVWMGVSIEDSRYTWRADVLREIPAAVRFISAEPLVGSLYPRPPFILGPARATVWSGPLDGLELDVVDAQISIGDVAPGRSLEPRARGDVQRAPQQDRVPPPRDTGHGQSGEDDATEEAPGRAHRAPLDLDGIDWVIVGGESGGPKSRPMHPSWARELRAAVLAIERDTLGDTAKWPVVSGPDGECVGPVGPFRPALFLKQWGSWSPAGIGDVLNTRLAVGLLPSGSQVTVAEAAETPGGEVMVYRGPRPTSGGKHFDGRMWCEFPQREMIVA